MTTPPLLCRFSQDYTLAAGVARDIDVPIDGAEDWCVVVTNTGGANAVTAGALRRVPITDPGPSTALPAGIPLAAGAALEVKGTDEPLTALRLTLTSTAGTTVRVQAGGR